MLDIQMLNKSGGEASLRDLMTKLYREYACKGKGLSEEDYIHELIAFGGEKALAIVENHLYGTQDFRASLKEALALVGLQIHEQENSNVLASKLGVKGLIQKDGFHIKQVQVDSVADQSKIAEGDIILTIDGAEINKDLLESLKSKDTIVMSLKRRFETIDIDVSLKTQSYYPIYKIVKMETITSQQKMLFAKWSNS
jgi:predicted metalloprotease with PDZ domain